MPTVAEHLTVLVVFYELFLYHYVYSVAGIVRIDRPLLKYTFGVDYYTVFHVYVYGVVSMVYIDRFLLKYIFGMDYSVF